MTGMTWGPWGQHAVETTETTETMETTGHGDLHGDLMGADGDDLGMMGMTRG